MYITLSAAHLQTILSTSSTIVEDLHENGAGDAQHGFVPVATLLFPHGIAHHRSSLSWRSLVRRLTLAVALAAVWTLSGCKKTGEGQYEVEKPVVGTETDTVNTPTVETGTVKDTITVPKVESEKKEVTLPKVEIKE
jgi:hypothetical protein